MTDPDQINPKDALMAVSVLSLRLAAISDARAALQRNRYISAQERQRWLGICADIEFSLRLGHWTLVPALRWSVLLKLGSHQQHV